MADIYVLLVTMIFCAIGIYFTVQEIASLIIKNDTVSEVIIEATGNADTVEAEIRNALAANPRSTITVRSGGGKESDAILEKLECDNKRLKIEKK